MQADVWENDEETKSFLFVLTESCVKVDFHESKPDVNVIVTETVDGPLHGIQVLQCMLGCLQVEAHDEGHIILCQLHDQTLKVLLKT